MGKILVSASYFDTLCGEAWRFLEDNGHEVIYDSSRSFPAYSYEELCRILPEIDAAIIGMDKYTDAVFQRAPRLKVVSKFGVGVDNIDIESAKRHGVLVTNAPGQNSDAVAELVLALILALTREVIPMNAAMRHGVWDRRLCSGISGKTVGLLGFGAVGRHLAKKLMSMDVKVKAFDLYPNKVAAAELGVEMTTQEDVIENSDIVSLHIPSTRESYHMFGASLIAKMKQGAYLINTARGDLVDTDALADALNTGWLAGAALDVHETEPLPADLPITKCANVILTPHVGSETAQAYRNVSMVVAADVVAALNGEMPKYLVR